MGLRNMVFSKLKFNLFDYFLARFHFEYLSLPHDFSFFLEEQIYFQRNWVLIVQICLIKTAKMSCCTFIKLFPFFENNFTNKRLSFQEAIHISSESQLEF